MIRTPEALEGYQARHAELARQARADGSAWLEPLRRAAMERFVALGFPEPRQEEWRYFDVSSLRQRQYRHVREAERIRPTREMVDRACVHCLPGTQLVFVDGHYEPSLSAVRVNGNGIEVGDLATALQTRRELLEPHLGRHAGFADQPFVALNTALVHDGAFVHVARGRAVREPIHLLFLSTGTHGASVSHPRTVVILDESAQVTLIEDYSSTAEVEHFTNPVTEIFLGENAGCDYYKLERESKKAIHVAAIQVVQDRDSRFESTSIAFGGHRVRNDFRCVLDGEGASCVIEGLNVIGDAQLVDDHTWIHHRQPRGTSQELYKSILDGQAEGVFNGSIYVAAGAQKTNSRQVNRNLVLSKQALMNTKPQLEIYADDVKCSHGATVGELDADAQYYLRARGIDAGTARRILTYAFAQEVLDHMRLLPLRKTVESELFSFIAFGPGGARPAGVKPPC